jgi:hypothetical protein
VQAVAVVQALVTVRLVQLLAVAVPVEQAAPSLNLSFKPLTFLGRNRWWLERVAQAGQHKPQTEPRD